MQTSVPSKHPLNLIPHPLNIYPGEGECTITAEMLITWNGEESESLAHLLAEYLRPATGFVFPVQSALEAKAGAIHLVSLGNPPPDEAGFFPEDYTILAEPGGITVTAAAPAGLARGIQTLRQLLPEAIFSNQRQAGPWHLPCGTIDDRPRFRWRGLHLDVSRHFFSVGEVCRMIELLALHRFNICHLHLVDDQGWRIEIRKYPRLTEVGSQRRNTLIGHESNRPRRYDDQSHGGFFTQEDIRTIVAFAERRKITVVPEIEMPGHAQAAIAAYPELGCGSGVIEPRCHWGISHHVFNVEEATLSFLCDVLDEVMELFPSRFIHIGGDEAIKVEWSESARVQWRMAELGIGSEEELQAWFIGRMAAHIDKRGRRLIGWDEILEGGLVAGATVMSWRGEDGGIAAARAGHDVVMAPGNKVYFDHYQAEPISLEPLAICGLTTTEQVYDYDPIPSELEPEHRHFILGAQGQLWTEYIPTLSHLEYMTYPRACALAEALWLPLEAKCPARFLSSLKYHRKRLKALEVNAHKRP